MTSLFEAQLNQSEKERSNLRSNRSLLQTEAERVISRGDQSGQVGGDRGAFHAGLMICALAAKDAEEATPFIQKIHQETGEPGWYMAQAAIAADSAAALDALLKLKLLNKTELIWSGYRNSNKKLVLERALEEQALHDDAPRCVAYLYEQNPDPSWLPKVVREERSETFLLLLKELSFHLNKGPVNLEPDPEPGTVMNHEDEPMDHDGSSEQEKTDTKINATGSAQSTPLLSPIRNIPCITDPLILKTYQEELDHALGILWEKMHAGRGYEMRDASEALIKAGANPNAKRAHLKKGLEWNSDTLEDEVWLPSLKLMEPQESLSFEAVSAQSMKAEDFTSQWNNMLSLTHAAIAAGDGATAISTLNRHQGWALQASSAKNLPPIQLAPPRRPPRPFHKELQAPPVRLWNLRTGGTPSRVEAQPSSQVGAQVESQVETPVESHEAFEKAIGPVNLGQSITPLGLMIMANHNTTGNGLRRSGLREMDILKEMSDDELRLALLQEGPFNIAKLALGKWIWHADHPVKPNGEKRVRFDYIKSDEVTDFLAQKVKAWGIQILGPMGACELTQAFLAKVFKVSAGGQKPPAKTHIYSVDIQKKKDEEDLARKTRVDADLQIAKTLGTFMPAQQAEQLNAALVKLHEDYANEALTPEERLSLYETVILSITPLRASLSDNPSGTSKKRLVL